MRATADAECLEIAIADNGVGIPPSRLPMIFEPYYTTKDEGTGLGLAISKRIVEEHQGTLTAQSKEGDGSTFKIRIPARVATFASAEI